MFTCQTTVPSDRETLLEATSVTAGGGVEGGAAEELEESWDCKRTPPPPCGVAAAEDERSPSPKPSPIPSAIIANPTRPTATIQYLHLHSVP